MKRRPFAAVGTSLAVFRIMKRSRKASRWEKTGQPLNWWRAFLCGVLGAIMLMAFVDCFNVMRATTFSLETYIGSLISWEIYPTYVWMLGFLVNCLLGGVFGFMYAYFFEYVFRASTARIGALVGLIHSVAAAVAFFPFFQVIHEFMGTGLFREFGFFGSGISAPTPLLLLFGHLAFGTTFGIFYGPVRTARARNRYFEPGEVGLPANHTDVVRPEDDASDRVAV
jgi:hypothetical protein